MTKLQTLFVRTVGLATLALMLATSAQAQSSRGAAARAASVERVEAKYVCMITNKHYEDVQIRVPIGEKTYYGCCRGCVAELKMNPESRTASDPVTGKTVDKATAVIGALPDGTVRYFGSEKTLRRFAADG